MEKVFLVGLGGFFGSIGRYGTAGLVQRFAGGAFPFGTVVVNVLGCILIGTLIGLSESKGLLVPETRLFLLVGMLGGFTTFSTFGYETYALLRDGQNLLAIGNAMLNVGVGLGGVWAGHAASRMM